MATYRALSRRSVDGFELPVELHTATCPLPREVSAREGAVTVEESGELADVIDGHLYNDAEAEASGMFVARCVANGQSCKL